MTSSVSWPKLTALIIMLTALPVVLFIEPQQLPFLIVLLIVPVIWIVTQKRLIPSTPFNVLIGGLFVMLLVSLWATPDVDASFRKVVNLSYGLVLFLTVADFAAFSALQLRLALALLICAGVALTLVGFAALSPLVSERLALLSTIRPNPNELAGIITYYFPLLLAVAAYSWRCVIRRESRSLITTVIAIASTLTLPIVAYILYTTASRAGLIAIAAALLFLFVLALVKNRMIQVGLGICAMLATVITLMLLIRANNGAIQTSGNALSLSGRVEIWVRAIYTLQDFPLSGVGMNMFRDIVHVFYPLFTIAPNFDIGHAHNHLLQAGLDLGIPGMIIYLALWIGSAKLLIWSAAKTNHAERQFMAAGLAGVLVAHFTFGLVDAIALGARPSFILWILFAAVGGLTMLVQREALQVQRTSLLMNERL